jgi:hypothetical protein
VVEKAKTLVLKRRLANSSHNRRDQLSAILENEEHCGCTQAISSIALWKEGFADESYVYKKRKTHEITHNIEDTFAQQFFNFVRKPPTICCANAYSRNQFGSHCHFPTLCSE